MTQITQTCLICLMFTCRWQPDAVKAAAGAGKHKICSERCQASLLHVPCVFMFIESIGLFHKVHVAAAPCTSWNWKTIGILVYNNFIRWTPGSERATQAPGYMWSSLEALVFKIFKHHPVNIPKTPWKAVHLQTLNNVQTPHQKNHTHRNLVILLFQLFHVLLVFN